MLFSSSCRLQVAKVCYQSTATEHHHTKGKGVDSLSESIWLHLAVRFDISSDNFLGNISPIFWTLEHLKPPFPR